MMRRAILGLATAALLSACGDDLESRQAAVQEGVAEHEIAVEQPQAQAQRTASAAVPTAQGFADEEEAGAGEELVFDAPPEALVDDAHGYSTDPIDDTSGFEPTPDTPQGFAPEPIGPESFEE